MIQVCLKFLALQNGKMVIIKNCPNCGSMGLEFFANGVRCFECGHEWAVWDDEEGCGDEKEDEGEGE